MKAYECKKFTPRVPAKCGRLDNGSKGARNLRNRCISSLKPRQLKDEAVAYLHFKSVNGKKNNKDMAGHFEKLGCQHTNIKSVKAAAKRQIEIGDLWGEAQLLEPAQTNIESGGGVLVVKTALGSEFSRMVDEAYRQKHKREQESETAANKKHKAVPYDPEKHRPKISAIVPDVEYVVGWVLISNAALAAARDKRAHLGDILTCDACHKIGMDAGTIYNVMARDSDNHNFHFAHAHFIGNENTETWKLVLQTLRDALDGAKAAHPRVFISDRDKGIKSALESVFPSAVPFMCRVHFERNLNSNCSNFKLVKSLYNACFYAKTVEACTQKMKEWKDKHGLSYKYMTSAVDEGKVTGCSSLLKTKFGVLFPCMLVVPLFGLHDNNPSEQDWARSTAVRRAVGHFKTLRESALLFSESYAARKEMAYKEGIGEIVPTFEDMLKEKEKRVGDAPARVRQPDRSDDSYFLVTSHNSPAERELRFNEGGGTDCSCGVPHVDGEVCHHGIKALRHFRSRRTRIVPPSKLTATWKRQHAVAQCCIIGDVTVLPKGDHKPAPAKPPKMGLREGKRHKAHHEHGRKKKHKPRSGVCGDCGSSRHAAGSVQCEHHLQLLVRGQAGAAGGAGGGGMPSDGGSSSDEAEDTASFRLAPRGLKRQRTPPAVPVPPAPPQVPAGTAPLGPGGPMDDTVYEI